MSHTENKYFSADYSEARDKFRQAVTADGAYDHQIITHPSGMLIDGEPLSTDIARIGPADARKLVILSSGLHGIEGFAGSAIQTQLITEEILKTDLPKDTAILVPHALNPHGFARFRRVNEDNVDVNRNFIDWSQSPPQPHPLSDKVQGLLLPDRWNWPMTLARALLLSAQHGRGGLQAALQSGQYNKPDGLFYGGARAAWTNTMFRDLVNANTTPKTEHIVHVDVHTGLGPWGHGTIIMTKEDPRAAAWWGDVEVMGTDDGISAAVSGDICNVFNKASRGIDVTTVGLEYGTLPTFKVLKALAYDNWVHAKGISDKNIARTNEQMRDAFAPRHPHWEQSVLVRGETVMRQALDGLKNTL